MGSTYYIKTNKQKNQAKKQTNKQTNQKQVENKFIKLLLAIWFMLGIR